MTVSTSRAAPRPRSAALVGIGLMLAGVFLFALNDVMGKWLVATYTVAQILLLRSAAALAVLLPLLLRTMRRDGLRLPAQPGLHALRAAFATLEVICFYGSVSSLPLADVMTFYLASPIYVAVVAVAWLGERLDGRRAAAIAVGFCGVLVMLRPSAATLTLPALVALTGSVVYAGLVVTTRRLKEASDISLVAGPVLGALAFGLAVAPVSWVPPGGLDFALLALLGIVALLAHLCVNRSLKLAPASVVAPYQYTLIVWAMILGYLVFGDVVGVWTLLGAAIICAAGLALLLIEHGEGRRPSEDAMVVPEL